jgi:hypothetical protein
VAKKGLLVALSSKNNIYPSQEPYSFEFQGIKDRTVMFLQQKNKSD